MAYYEGETLQERIERGPLGLVGVDIATQELVLASAGACGYSARLFVTASEDTEPSARSA